MKCTIDLQAHSVVSDGALEPAEVVKLAAAAGVRTFALSDHDAVDGVAEALAEAERHSIELIPAVELSCVHPWAEDLHLLGYWVEFEGEALNTALARARQDRLERAHRIAKRLAELQIHLDVDRAVELAGGALSLGRPHLAQAALTDPQNEQVLEGVDGISDFIRSYIIPGKPAFVTRSWPSPTEAINIVETAGGVAVLAHPFWDIEQPERVRQLIEELVKAGLKGVETFYPAHNQEQTAFLYRLCQELDLTPTASSDFHGPDHKIFSRFLAYETFGIGEPEIPKRP